MVEYRRSAHAVFDIKYHVVWITKYRYKVLKGRVAERARDLIRQICEMRDVVIVRGAVSPDHVHMLLSAPADVAPSKLVQLIKGRSSRRLQDEFPELRRLRFNHSAKSGWVMLDLSQIRFVAERKERTDDPKEG